MSKAGRLLQPVRKQFNLFKILRLLTIIMKMESDHRICSDPFLVFWGVFFLANNFVLTKLFARDYKDNDII